MLDRHYRAEPNEVFFTLKGLKVTLIGSLSGLLTGLSCCPQVLHWYFRAEPEDVFFTPRGRYNCRVLHSFGNARSRRQRLTSGTTHVAVGFQDLASLGCTVLRGNQDPDGSGCGEPLRWVGYDCSVYSVAKASVSHHRVSPFDLKLCLHASRSCTETVQN